MGRPWLMSWLFLLKLYHSKTVGNNGGMLEYGDIREKYVSDQKCLIFL